MKVYDTDAQQGMWHSNKFMPLFEFIMLSFFHTVSSFQQ
jgi:hypothetical protein